MTDIDHQILRHWIEHKEEITADDEKMRADDDKMRADDDKITADDDKMRAADDKITADGSPQLKFDFSLWPWPLTYTSGPGNMCIKFQINRSTIDDFRNSEKSQLSLTSRDEKTWLHTSTGVRYFRSGFRQRTFCNQLEVSTTYDAKVMAHYVFFMFGVILTLTFDLSRSLFLCGVNIDQLVTTKKILNIFCCWVFVIGLYLKKPMYHPCDLDLCPMKVNYFLWIYYQPMSILYKFEIDISTNSREIKYLNIEIWV